jgi:hypothetical protein
MIKQGITVNNYYLRNDGLLFFVNSIRDSIIYFRVILSAGETIFSEGEDTFDFVSDNYDYQLIDYEYGRKLEKFLTV